MATKAEERVTVDACCSTTGSLKVSLAVISTSKTPVCFQYVRPRPILYLAQRSVWFDTRACQEWFDTVFKPFIKKFMGRQIILMRNNCPGHIIKCGDALFIIIFPPPNVTSVYQPMDMGICTRSSASTSRRWCCARPTSSKVLRSAHAVPAGNILFV